jgi:cell division protein FtsL
MTPGPLAVLLLVLAVEYIWCLAIIHRQRREIQDLETHLRAMKNWSDYWRNVNTYLERQLLDIALQEKEEDPADWWKQ